MSSNSGASAFNRSYSGNEKNPHRPWRPMEMVSSPSPTLYKRAGSVTGNGWSITASMSERIAVVPPIPNARVRTAVVVKRRDAQNCLAALRIEAITRLIVLSPVSVRAKIQHPNTEHRPEEENRGIGNQSPDLDGN